MEEIREGGKRKRGRENHTRSKVGEVGLGVIDIDGSDSVGKRFRGRRKTTRIRVAVTSGNHHGQTHVDSSSNGIVEWLTLGAPQRHVRNLYGNVSAARNRAYEGKRD